MAQKNEKINYWRNKYCAFDTLKNAKAYINESQGKIKETIKFNSEFIVFEVINYKIPIYSEKRPWLWLAFKNKIGWTLIPPTTKHMEAIYSYPFKKIWFKCSEESKDRQK